MTPQQMLIARIAYRAMALDQARGEALLAALMKDGLSPETLKTIMALDGATASTPPYQVRDGVAIIDVSGVLMHGAVAEWERYYGFRSYDEITAALAKASADPNVRGILLHVDSPGGDAVGAADVAAKVYEARAAKPVHALAAGLAASAAYHIASAASTVHTLSTAMVGSIGVWNAHMDQTKLAEMMGTKVNLIHAGARKVDTSRYRPLDEPARAAMQQQVDDLYEVFTADVAKQRGMKIEDVKGTEARIYVGARAVEAGLADGVATLESALAAVGGAIAARTGGRLAAKRPASPARGGSMDLEQALAALADAKRELEAKGVRIKSLEDASAAMTTENADLRAQVTGLVSKAKEDVIERHALAGRVTPAMREDVGIMAKSLSPEELDARLGKWAVVTRPKPTGTSQGGEESDVTPMAQLETKAKEIEKATGKSYLEAFSQACRENPNLYKAHRAANTRVVARGK